jgi:glutathione-regulated potassium-efflux system ancillary protein KefG
MKRILVIVAHPALARSHANRPLVEAIRHMEGVTVHEIYELYPNFLIDTEREKSLLLQHEVIVFQHPFYWYNCPPLMKEWLDAVLEYGFAYGPEGTALSGKKFQQVITAGGPEQAYCCEGYNHFTMRELLRPFEQTANLCGMEYQEPFVVHDSMKLTHEQLLVHAENYRQLLHRLRGCAA